MRINELIKTKGLSRYSLAKLSGLPWATLADICSGKTSLTRCHASTLQKLARALELSIEDLLALEQESAEQTRVAAVSERSYYELNLSGHLSKAIADYVQGLRRC